VWLVALLLPLLSACVTTAHGGVLTQLPNTALAAPPLDPMLPGPYPVGVIQRSFMRLSTTSGALRVLQTVIWYPAAESARRKPEDAQLAGVPRAPAAPDGPFPVLVFSHGLASSPIQSTFLTAQLASFGFVVAAPSHPGTAYDDCFGCYSPEQQQALLRDGAIDRPDDASFTLDMLAGMNADPTSILYGAADTNHAGILGHSWGGYTAVMAAAADPRFRAALAMAPVVNATLEATARELRRPVMVMGSRLDDITPYAPQVQLFADLPQGVPHYLLTFPRGGHTAYSEVCPHDTPGCRPGDLGEQNAHLLVNAYAVAFLRVFVDGDNRYAGVLAGTLGGRNVEFTAFN
jgi:predicted dienelactone hydrolase